MNNHPTPSVKAVASSCEFPPELEREIFETTALLYPAMIPELLCVAQRVLLWKSIGGSGAVMLPRISTKGADFFANAVRHMIIWTFEWNIMGARSENIWSNKDPETVFRVCTRVEHLLLFSDLKRLPLLQMLVTTDMRPTRLFLMVDLQHPQLDFAQTFFRNRAHVRQLAPLAHHLSAPRPHLALGHTATPHLVQEILTGALHLKILILSSEDEHTAAIFTEQLVLHDPRVILVGPGLLEGFKLHAGTHSLDDLWAKADEFVARKQSGEIAASDYLMIPFESPPEASAEFDSARHSPVLEVDVEFTPGRHSSGSDADSPPADLGPDDPYARAGESDEDPDFGVECIAESDVWLLDLYKKRRGL
ncbi:hypothetical protein C8R44DRAFT_857977 [Mycena epipterygia]|nr:hypothetical protein C8R44DRAFT_857977 [Mycena epipterygia]